MPAVTVRKISVETHAALKLRAAARGVSTEAEVRAILDEAVRPEKAMGLGTELAKMARKHGGWNLDIERDKVPARFPTFE